MIWAETRYQPKAASKGGRKSLELALEVSELRYRRLFETAQDGILILDGEFGRIIDVNPFLLDLLDYPFDEIVGRQLWEIGLFEDIDANKASFAQLQTQEFIRYENHPLRTKSGKLVPVEFVSNVYFVGSERIIQCNIRDISQRAEMQAEAAINAGSLNVAAKAKDDVIAVLSHELRTPLAAISSMIDVVEQDHALLERLPPGSLQFHFSKNAAALIRRNVQTLARLINELLDLTHISKGTVQLKLEPIDAHTVIGFVLENLESQQTTNHVVIDLRLLAQHHCIHADSIKVEQVLSNLIGNAVKFTPEGGKVSILTRNEGGTTLVVEVSDTGMGITPDALARIFLPFEQGDASIHPRFGGLGLGLSIAQTLMKAQGGTLEAASDGVNRGARFTARFQLAESAAVLPPEPVVYLEKSRAGMRILLVEDQDDARRALCILLGSQGYQVNSAANLNAAIKLGTLHQFDLLITDVGLPDGNGLQLFETIKQNSPGLQGIALSGYGRLEDIDRAKKAGFFLHLLKPVQFSELRRAIESRLPAAQASSLGRLRE